jgi:hypothetical protein
VSDRPTTEKSLPTLVEELWALVVAYAKQETVEPLKGLGRFVLFGIGGSFLLGIGLVVMLLSGLRALQSETGSTFTGNLTWVPYGIVLGGSVLLIGLAVSAVSRGKGNR